MNTTPGAPAAPQADEPIANFSQCHVGIVEHLNSLGELPALMAPATRARQIAAQTLAFFDEVIIEHHSEEERDLFPAVLQSATRGVERERVEGIVTRLTAEHRQIEACWAGLKPQLKQVAKGHDARLDNVAIEQLVSDYRAHARFEEEVFLPLSQTILGRNANHMAALGLSLHMRHVKPIMAHI
jgi:hemerythrin-like domain-containing protein